MSKYTPGPWHVDMRSIFDIRVNQNADPDICICTLPIWKDEHRTEEIANAHLLAAAPELLEAAKELVIRYRHSYEIQGGTSKLPELQKLEQAIAKAEGGKNQ